MHILPANILCTDENTYYLFPLSIEHYEVIADAHKLEWTSLIEEYIIGEYTTDLQVFVIGI